MRRSNSPVQIPKGEEKTTTERRLKASQAGVELPVTLGDMMDVAVGEELGLEAKVVSALATVMHRAESDACSISWAAQERARAYRNEHGFEATVSEILRIDPTYEI